MTWERWPFPSDEAFWTWALDAYAELDYQDEDLLLHDVAGLHLLIAAADRGDCPKRNYCRNVVEHYAVHLISYGRPDQREALRAAAVQAGKGSQPRTLRLARYLQRLIEYRDHPHGPVNRALAERMAVDFLSSPGALDKLPPRSPSDWLTVEITASGKHWHCAQPWANGTHLYINRRTGAWRLQPSAPLQPDELAKI